MAGEPVPEARGIVENFGHVTALRGAADLGPCTPRR
jgi:hypothetical protein